MIRRVATRIGLALLLPVVALVASSFLRSALQANVFLLFLPAVMFAAWYGGLASGLVATVVSVALTDYYLLPPLRDLSLTAPHEMMELVVFSLIALVTGWLAAGLRREQARLFTTLSSIGDGVIVTDHDGRSTFLNPVAEALTGWRLDAAKGRSLDEVFVIVGEETRAKVENPAMRAMRHGTICGLANHTVLVGRDGQERPIEGSGAPVQDEFGRVSGSVLVFRDVTERRRADRGRAHLAAIVESSSDAIYAKTLAGVITNWNAAAERILGYSPDEAKRLSAATLTAPDRPQEEPDILDRLRRGERIDHFETVRIAKDGTPIDLSLTISPIKDAQGRVIGASTIARDITERKAAEQERARLLAAEQVARARAEEVLRRHQALEQRLSLLVEASGRLLSSPRLGDVLPQILELSRQLVSADGYGLWRIDPESKEWRILSASGLSDEYLQAAMRAYRDMKEAEIPFSTPLMIDDVTTSTLLEPNRDAYLKEGIRALVSVPVRINGRNTGSITFYHRSAHQFDDIEVRSATALANIAAAAISTAELYEEQSRLRGQAETAERRAAYLADASRILGSSLDYESTLRAVARLAVSQLADWCAVDVVEGGTIRQVVVAHADSGRVEWAHEFQRRYQVNPDDTGGLSKVLRTGEPEFYPEIQKDQIERSARDREHLQMILSLNLASYLCVPLVAHGRTLGALTFVTAESGRRYDTTDLAFAQELAHRAAVAVDNARLYQQAQEASRAKDEFLATLSHELRTPLNAVLGWARLLNGGKLDRERERRAIATIERNAEAQAQLIDDLLDVSRFVSGTLRLDVHPVELTPIIDAAVDAVRLAADAKGIQIRTDLDPTVGPVSGDAGRLQQVVWNLLSNAIKFTPHGGRVAIRLERLDTTARITVTDTGQGISPKFLPYVFERFRQADSTSTRTHGGLGLGLAIVRYLVELHGGTATVDSAGEGQGTTFVIDLPIAVGRATAPGSDREPQPRRALPELARPLDGLKLLVVEDDADGREFLVAMLQQYGAGVVAVGSAREALAAIEQDRFDALLSDIGMPEEDGFALIKQIRSLETQKGGRLPAAALTGFARPEDRSRVLASGFQGYIPKPIEPDALAMLLLQLTGRKERRV